MTCGTPACTTPALTYPATVRPPRAADALRLVARWIERSRQRRALALLDDDRLRDIGVTREAAEAEAAKPFWR